MSEWTRSMEKTMNSLDWILLGVTVICVVRGIWRGAVAQIFGIASLCGGFLTAAHYYEGVAARLAHAFPNLTAVHVISFITLFLLAWFCVGLFGFGISKLLYRTGLGFFDRFFGVGVGLGKALAFSIIVISTLTFFISAKSPLLHKSYLAPHIQGMARIVIQATPASVQQLFERKRLEIERYWTAYEKTRAAGIAWQDRDNRGVKFQQ